MRVLLEKLRKPSSSGFVVCIGFQLFFVESALNMESFGVCVVFSCSFFKA